MDWQGIARFRNVVVHDYPGIDLARVWDIVQQDLPKLKHSVAAMLAENDENMLIIHDRELARVCYAEGPSLWTGPSHIAFGASCTQFAQAL